MRSRGFTLLEVMVSVAISAIAIVGVLELFSGSTRLARLSVHHSEALIFARSLLDGRLFRTEIEDGEEQGSEGAFRYHVRIEPMEPTLGVGAEDDAAEYEPDEYELKRIDVVVSWDTPAGEKSIALSSARVVEVF